MFFCELDIKKNISTFDIARQTFGVQMFGLLILSECISNYHPLEVVGRHNREFTVRELQCRPTLANVY